MASKSPAQLQRDIHDALARRHTSARERWLSLQAGPHHRERQAAYEEMAAASRAIEGKRTHATKKQPAKFQPFKEDADILWVPLGKFHEMVIDGSVTGPS